MLSSPAPCCATVARTRALRPALVTRFHRTASRLIGALPARLLFAALSVASIAPTAAGQTISASGPDLGTTLEDRVEVVWTTATPVAATSTFRLTRVDLSAIAADSLLAALASTETLYEDMTAVPGVIYRYCVAVLEAGGTETLIACDTGQRIIARPTGFTATDGGDERHVALSWSDRSEIEAGYNLYRDAGNALTLDGTNDYVETDGIVDLAGSYTFEFWARRNTTNTDDYVINLETNPNGDPTDEDVEIGFNGAGEFVVRFGTEPLTAGPFADTAWHHWAMVYDAPNRRRFLYRDGVQVATDIRAMDSAPTGDLEFGRRDKNGSAASRGHFDGDLDEIRYWSAALTADQVQNAMGGLLRAGVANLAGYWPMDVASGTGVPDVTGETDGTLVNTTGTSSWTDSGATDRYVQLGPDLTAYLDNSAVIGFQSYTYRLAAFEDVDGDGVYTAGTDYESEQRTDTGWRAFLTPPGDVSATDGQFNDRVRITWTDLSVVEEGYDVYRDGTLIGSIPADSMLFDDKDATGMHAYCVRATGDGQQSEERCDAGMVGGLPAPVDVAATDRVFDDRVALSWEDAGDTEDGFEIYRGPTVDGTIATKTLLATLEAGSEDYNDLTALQDVDYEYCVRAFSEADPLSPSYSDPVCATGARAIILDPTDLTATQADFEERVDLRWQNPSTTAMLFQVYRDGVLIEVLDVSRTFTMDTGIPSDTDLNYCVSAATVVAPSAALRGEVAQVLQTIRHDDAVRVATGGAATSPEEKLAAVYEVLGLDRATASKSTAAASGFEESGQVCATGSRSLAGPTDVDATDDEFEDHVQINWTDNSSFETGYRIYRTPEGGGQELAATLSPNRTTYGDYTGVPGLQYTYTVEAFDAFDASQTDSDLGIRTLKPPTNFTASDGTSEREVVLAWRDNSSAEGGYRITRSTGGATPVLLTETGPNDEGYVDTVPNGLLGDSLAYTVVAFDAVGTSVAVSDTGLTALEAPANVNASDVYDDRVVVVWVDRSEVEANYIITRREVGTDILATPVIQDSSTTMYTDFGAQQGKAYAYCVQAVVNSTSGQILSAPTCDVGELLNTGGVTPPTGVAAQRVVVDPFFLTSVVDGAARIGHSVAMDGSTGLLGAPGADDVTTLFGPRNSSGWVARFTYAATSAFSDVGYFGRTVSTPEQEEYGFAVDISGSYAIVGDPFRSNSRGGAFEIWKNAGGWSSVLNVTAPVGIGNAGASVAMLDSFAVVGDNVLQVGGKTHGGALVCNVEAAVRDGTSCRAADAVPQLETLLSAGQQVKDAEFGFAVDLTRIADSLFAIVGAPGNDLAYIFACDVVNTTCGTVANWALTNTLDTRFSPNDRFGADVAISPRLAVVGAPGAEGVLVYERDENEWIERTPFSPSTASVEFGAAVALQDSIIIVGAPGEQIADFEAAGAVYTMAWDSTSQTLTDPVRYDARVDGTVRADARFGASVDVSDDVGGGYYLVGAPGDIGLQPQLFGAGYLIPFGFEPPDDLILPEGVSLALPSGIRASDGTAPDRIQIRWDDESDDEDGHLIYRSNATGEIELLGETAANIEFFDDFDAAPGEAYTYCVSAFFGDTETEQQCDIGWRPPNGTISGRVAVRDGAGTDGAEVCLMPSPNKALIFDGEGGYIEAAVGEELDLFRDFTIEAWIRPQATDALRYIVAKDSAYALALNSNQLRFTLFRPGSTDDTFDATTLPPLMAGTWYHVAASMDADRNVTLYLNGVEESKGKAPSLGNTIGDSLAIGQRGNRAGVGAGFFEGEIDEVRIWNEVRTATELAENRFEPFTGEEENLVAYWPLDQGLRRVVPDITEFANHGRLIDGVYLADEGAELNVCALTGADGNYSIDDIRYGESAEFSVIPTRTGRRFAPSFKSITLTIESPVQNEVFFNDVTAYEVAGFVQYVDVVGMETFTCPVPDVQIAVSKASVAADDDVKDATGADGGYAVAVDPSVDAGDTWFIIPQYTNPANDEEVHTFTPTNQELVVQDDLEGINFVDNQRYTLAGNFSGGDPDVCGKNIGVATIRIYTQDGCYDRLEVVDSKVDNGAFSYDLPPLEYLVEVVSIADAPADREAEIIAFFEQLGTLEVDLTQGDAERNLIYRAPITLAIEGLDAPVCPSDQFVQNDEDGNTLRVLPAVPVIGEFEGRALTIKVQEDYGNGEFCPVDEGTVTIIDAIADQVDQDSTVALSNGEAQYTTFGVSPNIFAGARIGGVDRSFQKPITVIAQVEGRPTITETQWAIVEGFRERAATFVSATTEEFPLLMLHDPPGSNSFSYLEQGATICTRISNTKMSGGGAGPRTDVVIGLKSDVGFSFGAHFSVEGGAGLLIQSRTIFGRENGSLNGQNIEICLTTTERYATSDDPGFVGEDIHVGVALNLIFALADVLAADQGTCTVNLSETIATDLDKAEPFATTYAFGKSHIALSLIPQLENLIRLGGDVALTGEIGGSEETVRLQSAVDNWKRHLAQNEAAKEAASNGVNRSFSGGADYEYAQQRDTSRVTDFTSTRIYIDSENSLGFVASVGYDQVPIAVDFVINAEWNSETETTQDTTTTMGYVLSDGDTGDYFSVDIGADPRYRTPVFKTLSGRSSNPAEAGTQHRDNPIIGVDPPVQFNVDPGDVASFDVTLINGSESDERRRYALAVAPETNRGNLGINIGGSPLGGPKEYLIDAGKAITVTMDATASPSAFSYRDVGLIFYPPDERPIWAGDTRLPFALSDTARFSVFFDSTGGTVLASQMEEGWNWVSINREGGDVNKVLDKLPAKHGDLLRSQRAESRYDSTAGWTGTLTALKPGEGYRIRLQEPSVLRVPGTPLDVIETLELTPGWSWIGYLPAKRLPINDALASLNDRVMPGDAIVGQHAFAQYVKGIGWVGPLRDLEPGEGYALYLDGGGDLHYPEPPDQVLPRPPVVREVTVDGPEWDVQAAAYDASMTVVAELHLGGAPMAQTATKIAVFDGELIRGTGEVHYIEALDRYLAFILVYGDVDEETDLTVHVYDGERDGLYEDVATIPYAAQSRLGQPASPVVIELTNAGQAPLLTDLPEVFALHANYPNPFNTYTTIGYDLPEAADIELIVYDMLGRRVAKLVDGEQPAGRHKAVFDGRRIASGFYVYRMKIGEATHVGKMILVK